MTQFTRGMLLVAAVMLLAGTPARAQITNGSFESDYAGWTFVEDPAQGACNGIWGIAATGSTLPLGGVVRDFHSGVPDCAPTPASLPITFTATDGNQLAFQLQTGVQFDRMYQDIDVGPGLELHWDMQYLNHAAGFNENQYLAVRIRDSVSDAIIKDLFITKLGAPQSNADHPKLTPFQADLAAFAGMKVRLSVDIQITSDFIDVQLDNFKLVAKPSACTPPSITSVTATPSVIWPPNHKKVLVTVSVDATAVCGPPVCKIVAITRDAPDARIVGALTAEIRAEGEKESHGQTYTITVECTDTAGNATRKDTQVFVPHDRREHDQREHDHGKKHDQGKHDQGKHDQGKHNQRK